MSGDLARYRPKHQGFPIALNKQSLQKNQKWIYLNVYQTLTF